MSKNALKWLVFAGLFAVPFIPFLVSSAFFFPFITSKAFAWRIIVEIVFAAWVLLALLDPEYRPKKSLILYAVFGFIVAIGISDLFGAAPVKSFWSNYERMEGFISLLHLGAYFIVISSVFREADWKRWWNASLVASALMVCYALFQVLGVIRPSQSDARVDGTFGNAIYLAVYLLFHIFVALFFMAKEWKNAALRSLYTALILAQLFILYFTATRGAILGLLGGLLILALINLRNKEEPVIRKLSIGVLATLVIVIGGFFAVKDTQLVANSPVLSRFATLNLEDLKTQGRYFIWPMAITGISERPILGWGQDNFNYIFQKYYQPEMYHLEAWFDRAHNVFLDWAVAGGLVGFLSYISLYLLPLYLLWRDREKFSSTEKSIIVALIAAYAFHNFFVFDHLLSYILFFSLLSYIHSRISERVLSERIIEERKVNAFALPAAAILLLLVLYFVNIKPIVANTSLINAMKSLQSGQPAQAIENFQIAYNSARLGRPEVVEQLNGNYSAILASNLPIEERNKFYAFAQEAIREQAAALPNDTRYEFILGSFLSGTGSVDEGIAHLERTLALAPKKQLIYFELGSVYFNKNDPERGLAVFKEAYDLAPGYVEAKAIYLIGAIHAGDRALETRLISELDQRQYLFDDRIIQTYFTKKRFAEVIRILEERIKLDPNNAAVYGQLLDQVRNSE